MTSLLFWTCAISVVTAIACSVCGSYLVAKREALISEGLGHAVLPGIIVGFLVFQDRNSPWLIISAALTGLGMVVFFQYLRRTRLVDSDASLGIVFSAMFSGGVILSSQNLRNVHFHAECIIDGNIAAAALDTITFGDYNLGPRTFWVMLAVLSILILFITLLYKEMNVMTFDGSFAEGLNLHPNRVHLIWLGLVSLTTVSAFETAGSVLVVALMIAPPAAAYLLSSNMFSLIFSSALLASVSAVAGVLVGYELDISPAGPIACCAGVIFLAIALFAPKQGLISRMIVHSQHRKLLCDHLFLCALGNLDYAITTDKLHEAVSEIIWSPKEYEQTLKRCLCEKLIAEKNGIYSLTAIGHSQIETKQYLR